jgi:hypothetical protein
MHNATICNLAVTISCMATISVLLTIIATTEPETPTDHTMPVAEVWLSLLMVCW